MFFKLFKKSFKNKPLQSKKTKKTKSKLSETKKKVTEKKIGVVTHYFPKVKAGVVKVMGEPIKIGDRIHIKGHTTDFKQKVTSIQINNKSVLKAQKSEEIGILVKSRVRIKDIVYKIDTDKNKGDNYEQKKSKK